MGLKWGRNSGHGVFNFAPRLGEKPIVPSLLAFTVSTTDHVSWTGLPHAERTERSRKPPQRVMLSVPTSIQHHRLSRYLNSSTSPPLLLLLYFACPSPFPPFFGSLIQPEVPRVGGADPDPNCPDRWTAVNAACDRGVVSDPDPTRPAPPRPLTVRSPAAAMIFRGMTFFSRLWGLWIARLPIPPSRHVVV